MNKKISNLSLILTKACNLHCKYCYYNDSYYNNNGKMYLHIDKFQDFVKNNNISVKLIYITGGEPLLHKNFTQFVELSCGIAEKVIVATNGTLLSYEKAKKLRDNNVGLNISVDSLDKEYIDSVRGQYDAVFKTLDMLYQMEYKDIKLTPTVTSQNLNMIDDLCAYCTDREWEIEISFVEIERNNSLSLHHADIDKLRHIININANKVAVNLNDKYVYGLYVEELILKEHPKLFLRKCYSAENNLVIDTDGKIYACFHDKNEIGTMEDDIDKIIESKRNYLENKNFVECMRIGCL